MMAKKHTINNGRCWRITSGYFPGRRRAFSRPLHNTGAVPFKIRACIIQTCPPTAFPLAPTMPPCEEASRGVKAAKVGAAVVPSEPFVKAGDSACLQVCVERQKTHRKEPTESNFCYCIFRTISVRLWLTLRRD